MNRCKAEAGWKYLQGGKAMEQRDECDYCGNYFYHFGRKLRYLCFLYAMVKGSAEVHERVGRFVGAVAVQ